MKGALFALTAYEPAAVRGSSAVPADPPCVERAGAASRNQAISREAPNPTTLEGEVLSRGFIITGRASCSYIRDYLSPIARKIAGTGSASCSFMCISISGSRSRAAELRRSGQGDRYSGHTARTKRPADRPDRHAGGTRAGDGHPSEFCRCLRFASLATRFRVSDLGILACGMDRSVDPRRQAVRSHSRRERGCSSSTAATTPARIDCAGRRGPDVRD